MRFMMLMVPKGYGAAAPGAMPDPKAVAALMKDNESLKEAGVLPALDGLHPPVTGARVSFAGGQPKVDRGAFRRGEGGDRRAMDDPGEIEGRGDRMGVALPGFRKRGERGPPGAAVLGLPCRGPKGRGRIAGHFSRRLPRPGRGLISTWPNPEGCDLYDGEIVGCELIVAGGDATTSLDFV
jgi:hypothetical protein